MKSKTYTKYHGKTIYQDLKRLAALEYVCSQVSNCTTVTVIDKNETEQTVTYKYLDFPKPIIKKTKDTEFWFQLGLTLVKLHQVDFKPQNFTTEIYPLKEFRLNKDEISVLNKEIPRGWFHGDFWHENVVLFENSFLIIDPIPTNILFDTSYIFSSGVLDVASMYMSVFIRRPANEMIFLNIGTTVKAAESFLNGYLQCISTNNAEIKKIIRNIAYQLCLRFIDSYSDRLLFPVALIKKMLAEKIIKKVDMSVGWSKR